MGDQTNNETAIAQALGQLTGKLDILHQGLTADIKAIRDDLHRSEDRINQRIEKLEDNINKRIDSMGSRVSNLEAEDKRIIEKVAKLSAFGGGVGGALAAAAVELIKRI